MSTLSRMRVLLCSSSLPLALLGLASSGAAQGPVFAEPREISAEVGPAELHAVDLDGDGDVDLVSNDTSNDTRFAIHENLGGSFAAAVVLGPPSTYYPWRIAVGDLDGDGRADLVSAATVGSSYRIQWERNVSGPGIQFVPGGDVAPPTGFELARDLEVVDLDGDGHLDVVASASAGSSSSAPGAISWFQNLGGGVFAPEAPVGPGSELTPADVDGDGDADLVVYEVTGALRWIENQGGGAFGGPTLISDEVEVIGPLRCADLDGDGDLDVLAGNPEGEVVWFANDGAGTFSPAVSSGAGLAPNGVLATGDLDGDGDIDVVAESGLSFVEGSQLRWVENLGGGSFAPPVSARFERLLVKSLLVADADGDGDLDIVSGSPTDHRLVWSENLVSGDCDGDGQPDRQQIATDPALDCDGDGALDACQLEGRDCDGDGQLDACQIAANGQLDRNGDGVLDACQREWFGAPVVLATDLDSPPHACAADLDGDGVPDVVIGTATTLNWRKGLGDRTFGPEQPLVIQICSSDRTVLALDVGADGDMDLVVWGIESITVGCQAQLIENLGGGTFAPPVLLSIAPKTIEALDLDGDGDLDLVASERTSEVWRLVNNPDGLSVPTPLLVYPPFNHPPSAADLDGDQDVDLVTSNGICIGGSASVTFHENDGTGGFLPAVDLADGEALCAPWTRLGDLDGDGDLDVLVLDGVLSPPIQVVRNDGQGRFAGERSLHLGNGGYGLVFAGDLDVDGDPDLLLTNWSGEAVVWSEGDGYGSLPPARAPSPPYRFDGAVPPALPYGGAPPADVDGDLDLDLFWTRELPSGLHELSFRPNLALEDCDGDGTSDRDQIALDPQLDVNGDGVLDRCQLSLFDCNQNGVFDPLEVGSGASTDANGDRILDECQAIGQTYCTSSGGEASLLPSMLAVGSDAVEDWDLTLIARFLPLNSVGYFVASRTPGNTLPVPGSIGRLCVSGSVGRAVGGVLDSGTLGTLVAQVDLAAIPQPTGPVAAQPGETWHFQAWHRTTLAGQPTSNFTDAVRVTLQ